MTPHAFAAAFVFAAAPAFAEPPGLLLTEVDAPHHGRAIDAAIWYPSAGGGEPIVFAENPVFYGVEVVEGAQMLPGPHPVVLLSHGMGGGIRPMAWLAAGLAERGAIVVSVSHPGTTWSDFDMARGLRHWTRAQDLSAALDAVLETYAGQIDVTRVMAMGFSYGGWTALSLGGMRNDHAGFVATCKSEGFVECAAFLGSGVEDADPEVWDADYRDPRVTHVVALEPGLIWGLEADDADGLIENVRLIGLGAGSDRLGATDFEASGFADIVPHVPTEWIAPAVHFTGLPVCKPAGAEILAADDDDPVCTDPDGTDRAAVHAAIIDRAASDLGL